MVFIANRQTIWTNYDLNKRYNLGEEKRMPKHNADKMKYAPAEANDIHVSIGKITKNTQLTTNDTGWSAAEKERMRKFGYDGIDIIKEWYR